MSAERVRWTKCKDGTFEASMRGNVYLSLFASQEGHECYRWRANGRVGRHWVDIRADLGKATTSLRQAKRRAREAGQMVQKIVGVDDA